MNQKAPRRPAADTALSQTRDSPACVMVRRLFGALPSSGSCLEMKVFSVAGGQPQDTVLQPLGCGCYDGAVPSGSLFIRSPRCPIPLLPRAWLFPRSGHARSRRHWSMSCPWRTTLWFRPELGRPTAAPTALAYRHRRTSWTMRSGYCAKRCASRTNAWPEFPPANGRITGRPNAWPSWN